MGCLRTDVEYEGKIIEMSKKQKNGNSNTTAYNEKIYTIPESTIKFMKWVAGGCGFVLTAILGVVSWLAITTYNMNGTVQSNVTLIGQIQGDINDIEDDIDELEDRVNQVASAEIPHIYASADIGKLIVSIQEQDVPLTGFPAGGSIGQDINGKSYPAQKMVNETMLLSYEEDGKIVYFLGQFNENYHWDGRCITNAYNSDGTLYGVCESDFDDGVRQSYKTILYMNPNEWDYYERERVEIGGEFKNVGISASYQSSYNRNADFTQNNVRSSDILYTSDFFECYNNILKQYYSGETAESKYNDKTGEAYLIKFADDGTVNSLYVGQFVDGKLEDNSGDAWNIIYSEADGYYVCNEGKFKDNHAVDYADVPFSQDDINEKIEGYTFDCELSWKEIE